MTTEKTVGMDTSAPHSHIGASSMSRWMKCPGSVGLSKGIEKKSSAYADEGTLAHDLAATRILSGEWSPNIDPEMQEHLAVYVDFVENLPGGDLLVEHKFDLSAIHPGLFGTCDAVSYDVSSKVLTVVDLKFGAGIPVEATNNVQLKYYALGALLSTRVPVEAIELVIVQPRCFHPDGPIRKFRMTPIELLDFADDLKKYAMETEKDDAAIVPGDHCRFCPASGICSEVRTKAQALAKLEFGKVGELYDAQKLANALEWLPVLETWIKGVRDFAYQEATRGKVIPGWKLVEKRKTRKWRDESIVTQFLSQNFKTNFDDFFEKPTLKSVAQVEKVIGKKAATVLSSHIVAESSGNTLVEVSDSRPEVKVLDARTEFEALDMLS